MYHKLLRGMIAFNNSFCMMEGTITNCYFIWCCRMRIFFDIGGFDLKLHSYLLLFPVDYMKTLINSFDSIGSNQHYHKYSLCPETWLTACIMKIWKTIFLFCWNNSLVGSTVFQLNLFAHWLWCSRRHEIFDHIDWVTKLYLNSERFWYAQRYIHQTTIIFKIRLERIWHI